MSSIDVETAFAVLTGVIAFLVLAMTAKYRIAARRAAASVPAGEDRASTHSEGKLIWVRPLGFLIWLALIGYVASPSSMRWSTLDLPIATRWIGAAVAVLAVLMIFWTLRHIGANLSSGVVPLPHHHLVTSGPYRRVRHPWYVALLLLLLGLAMMWSSWVLGLLILMRAFYYLSRAPIEDAALAARFGEAHREWAARVPAFIPRLGRS